MAVFTRFTFALCLAPLCSAFLLGCQTTRYHETQSIKPGMDKSEVIETAGGPNRSERYHDEDQWTYTDPSAPPDGKVREVHFVDGQAVYVGPPIKPKVSAEEQDRINAEEDARQAQIDAAFERQRDSLIGAVRADPRTHEGSTPVRVDVNALDADDRRLQESLYGTSPEQEKNKVAPHFEVVE
jgi:outer membrane protein assembly factor BamE (lipoprotein component of BamABCDE complex)